jgi:hypothetical protein
MPPLFTKIKIINIIIKRIYIMRRELKDKKKQGIMNTLVCYWEPKVAEDEGGYWVVESPLATDDTLGIHVAGVHPDKKQAYTLFDELLDDALEDYYKGRLPFQKPRVGHPAKNRKTVSLTLIPRYDQAFNEESRALGIKKGEFVEFLLEHYRASKKQPHS